jgi:hypothetical protein
LDLAAKQPLDSDLTALAALVSAANKLPYATGAGTWSLTDLTTFARTLLDDANAAAARSTLGVSASPPAHCVLPSYLTSGNYTAPGLRAGTTSTSGVGTLRLTPLYIPNSVTLSKVGVEVTTVGEAGSKVRLGIFADDGTGGNPTTLLVDAGQINGDSATYQELDISLAVDNAQIWLGVVLQNITTTSPTMRSVGAFAMTAQIATGGGLISNTTIGHTYSGVTGALSTLSGTPSAAASASPKVWVKAA